MRDTETPDATGITSEEQLLQKAKKLLATDVKYACNLKYPFSRKSMCMHRDCRSQAEERIFFINEDTVHEADVCTNHAVLFKQGNKVIFPFKLGLHTSNPIVHGRCEIGFCYFKINLE